VQGSTNARRQEQRTAIPPPGEKCGLVLVLSVYACTGVKYKGERDYSRIEQYL
jgi:hypothetical protein